VALDHPAEVAGPAIAQHGRGRRRGRQERLDLRHGVRQALQHRRRQMTDQPGRGVLHPLVERGHGLPARLGEAQSPLTAVLLGRGASDQALRHQPAQDATEIARVEAEGLADLTGRGRLAGRQFAEHPRLGRREASVHALAECAHAAGVETVEAASAIDKRVHAHKGESQLVD
jgi:hypothetical protein